MESCTQKVMAELFQGSPQRKRVCNILLLYFLLVFMRSETERPEHCVLALLAVGGNFRVSLLSGAAQGADAHAEKSWLHRSHRLEGQTPHWCSFCFSSGPRQMRLCSGKFSAALTLPSVLVHLQCTDEEEKELSKRKKSDSFGFGALEPTVRPKGHLLSLLPSDKSPAG